MGTPVNSPKCLRALAHECGNQLTPCGARQSWVGVFWMEASD